MKKGIKLLVLLAVLCLMIVGYVVFSGYMQSKENEGNDDAVDTSVSVLSIDSATVSNIDYKYLEEDISLKKDGDTWQWSEDAEFPLDQTFPDEMASYLSKIVGKRVVAENLDNEADFGMDEPYMVINYSTIDGKSYVYTIGSYNSAAKCYYFKHSTQDRIFMTGDTAADPFVYYKLEMADGETLPTFNAEDVTSATYNGPEEDDGRKIFSVTTDSTGADFYSDPYSYFYVENGKKHAADGRAVGEFMVSVEGLALGSIVDYKPSEEKLKEYGLDEGSRIGVNVVYNEAVESTDSNTSVSVTTSKAFTVYIGKGVDEDGKEVYYGSPENSKFVYSLYSAEAFYKASEADFISKLICPVSADDTVSFKVELDANNIYFYKISDIENNEQLTGIFNALTSLVTTGETDKEKGELLMKVTFEMSDRQLLLSVYKLDGESCVVEFDNRNNILVSLEKINGIIDDLKSISAS